MQLQHLKYFLQIAETGSMNKAAKGLYVSQPSLSKAMSCLEEELSIQIFRRDNRGVSLTEDGKKLYMYTKNILNQMEDLTLMSSACVSEQRCTFNMRWIFALLCKVS